MFDSLWLIGNNWGMTSQTCLLTHNPINADMAAIFNR